MTTSDQFGYAVTAEPAAVAPWDRTVTGFLAHAAETPTHLGAALEADPRFGLAHAAKGLFLLLLGRRELVASARDAHALALAERPRLTPREQAVVDALGAYLDGRMTAAGDILQAVLTAFPRDGLLMKLVHAIRFVLGDAPAMRRSLEGVISAYGADNPARGYARGCLAFALEETGSYLAAERAGRDAMDEAVNDGYADAWGLHAVAHVFDMTNRCTEGVAWIRKQPGAWAHCNNFAYHVWWHLALFHLDRGEHAETLRLYDQEIRADKTDDYRDLSNAAALLMRLELEGVDVGGRWEELAAISEARVDDGCVVFADLHYMLALGDRPEAAASLLGRMRTASEDRQACMNAIAADAGVPAAAGLRAFAAADYASAYTFMTAAQPHLQRVGGSHAQRDVFERVGIDAALRAGLLAEARAAIQARARRRGALDGYAERRLARIATLQAEAALVAAE